MQKYTKINPSSTLTKQNCIFIILSTLCFFIGRINIFHMLNPVAISFLGCLLLRGKLFNISLIFTILGLFSKSSDFYISKYVICITLLFLSNIIFKNKKLKNNILIKSIISSLAIFISGIIICIINGFSAYYLVVSVLEASLTFSLCFVLNKGVSYILNDNKILLTNEEIISISIIIGAIIYGSSDVFIGNISLTYFFIITLLLFVCYIYGSSIASMVSILSTFLLIISSDFSPKLIIVFTVSSVVCSLFREKGKIALSVVFGLCTYILMAILNIPLLNNELIFSLLGSVLLFLTIPIKIVASANFTNVKTEYSATHTEKIQILTSNKLDIYADSFEKLSKTFYNLSDKKTNLDQRDVSNLIDEVASKVCKKCVSKPFCWEKNFYSTYQNIFLILDMYEKTGTLTQANISKDFIENCININQFIDVLNKTFEIYKLNLLWKNKLIESRELVGQQLTSISSIISKISKNLCENVCFKENMEDKIKKALEYNHIRTKNVIITENDKGKLEVLLKIEPCYVPNKCSKTIVPIVNELLGKKMCRNNFECIIKKEGSKSICSLSLVEEQRFKISTSVISTAKKGSDISGDSHCFLALPNGNYLLALSDGMGSGKYAKAQSSATIELLEDFMQAGFSKSLAINMINSVLFLKSSKESFATLDMCNIDLYTGICEFIKIGAVSTFIVHKDTVTTIQSSSLPVGILNNVEPETRKKKLSANDIIVMVTDGAIDASNDILDKEKFICDILAKNISKNPEDIAKSIYEKILYYYNENIKDDVTILVARLWNSN